MNRRKQMYAGRRRHTPVAVFGERLEDRRLLAATGFTLLPNQSVLTLKVNVTYNGFPLSFSSQGPSALNSSETSLTTHFVGTLLASVSQSGAGTLQFDSGSSVAAEVNGNWDPGLNPGVTGNATTAVASDFGGKTTVPFTGTEYVAARGLVFDFNSPVINQSGGSYAVDNVMHILPAAGQVYYDGISGASGSSSIVGDDETDMSGRTATLVTTGGTQTLTVPINVTYSDTTTLGTITSIYTGTLVGTAPVPSANYYVKRDSDGTHLDIYNNSTGTGTVAEQLVFSQVSSMMLATSSGAGSITINNSAGSAVPTGGLTLTGDGSTSLLLIGSGSGDTIAQNSGQILFNSTAIDYTGMMGTTLNPNGGTDVLSVNVGELMLSAAPTGGGILKRLFSSITIGTGAELAVLTPAAHSDHAILVVTHLTIAGSTGHWAGLLDLGGNDMDLQNGTLANVSNMAMAAFNAGTPGYQPEGIISSTASASAAQLTTLGVIQNNQGGTTIYGNGTGQTSFEGTIPGASDILIKYTYYGDTNLDGKVDGSDYSRIDNGFAKLTSWFNGDFNYDGAVNGSDYTLIDNAFNRQAASPLAAMVWAQVATTSRAEFSSHPTAAPGAFAALLDTSFNGFFEPGLVSVRRDFNWYIDATFSASQINS